MLGFAEVLAWVYLNTETMKSIVTQMFDLKP